MDLNPESREAPGPISSPGHDARRLKESSAATSAEIREFLAEMRGKSPAEMLGAIANSSLFSSLIQATILIGVLIAVFTIIPFALNKIGGGDEGGEVAAAEEGATEPKAAEGSGEATAEGGTDPAPSTTEAADPDTPPAGTAERLGIGDEIVAPPDVNPLDGSNDDLLDGLD